MKIKKSIWARTARIHYYFPCHAILFEDGIGLFHFGALCSVQWSPLDIHIFAAIDAKRASTVTYIPRKVTVLLASTQPIIRRKAYE